MDRGNGKLSRLTSYIVVLISCLVIHHMALANSGGTVIEEDDGNKYYVGTVKGRITGPISNMDTIVTVTDLLNRKYTPFKRAAGGYSTSSKVTKNTLTISIPDKQSLDYAYGGYSKKDLANNNIVNIRSHGTVNHVYGGFSNKGAAENNIINIHSGEVKHVYGGYSENVSANHNKIHVQDGNVEGPVCGGLSNAGSANHNVIHIHGGSIRNGYIYGGWAEKVSPSYNTIIISGNPDLTGSNIYGGYDTLKPTSTGNTLEIRTKDLADINHIDGFEAIRFIIPSNIQDNQSILTVKNIDTGRTQISIDISGNSTLKQGDRIILIHQTSGNLNRNHDQKSFFKVQNASVTYELTLHYNQQFLIATVDNVSK